MTRFIGDVHGKYDRYMAILKESPPGTIQVGDMGVGFLKWPHGEPQANPPYDLMVEKQARFIRGNHDNPEVCMQHTQYIPDGHIEDDVMFIGGGFSIDRAFRQENFNWWEDEEISHAQLNQMVDLYIAQKPRVMITHDCPEEVAQTLVDYSRAMLDRKAYPEKLDSRFTSRTRQAFQSMWSAHSPAIWVFGHWHQSFDHILRGTRFICLAELEYKDIDIADLA